MCRRTVCSDLSTRRACRRIRFQVTTQRDASMRPCMLRSIIAVVVCAHLSISPLVAEQPIPTKRSVQLPRVWDVALDVKSSFRGEVHDREGQPRSNTRVELWRADQKVQQAQSDAHGKFVFVGVKSGLYQVRTATSVAACRIWNGKLAPPSAKAMLLVVTSESTMRGQQPLNEVFCFNPFVMGTIISSAVAIPIAVHDSGDGQLEDGS